MKDLSVIIMTIAIMFAAYKIYKNVPFEASIQDWANRLF